MKSLKQKYTINSPVESVWKALVDPVEIEGWGAGPAIMDEKDNYEFKLWGGDVWGTNTKVIKNKLLEQDWFGGNWGEPSKVIINLTEKNYKTLISLTHTNIPQEEFGDIKSGWKEYYFGPLKEFIENKSS